MKTRGWMAIVVLAMAAILAAPAVAQTINLRADVPFDFIAGDVAMKAGHCTVQTISNNVVRLSDADKNNAAAILTWDDLRSADDMKLVFRRYGDNYFLARIETPSLSYKVFISKREMKLAHSASPKEVAVLAYPAAAGE